MIELHLILEGNMIFTCGWMNLPIWNSRNHTNFSCTTTQNKTYQFQVIGNSLYCRQWKKTSICTDQGNSKVQRQQETSAKIPFSSRSIQTRKIVRGNVILNLPVMLASWCQEGRVSIRPISFCSQRPCHLKATSLRTWSSSCWNPKGAIWQIQTCDTLHVFFYVNTVGYQYYTPSAESWDIGGLFFQSLVP